MLAGRFCLRRHVQQALTGDTGKRENKVLLFAAFMCSSGEPPMRSLAGRTVPLAEPPRLRLASTRVERARRPLHPGR
jgi:hypothetical protein